MNSFIRAIFIAASAFGFIAASNALAEPAAKPVTAVLVEISAPAGITRGAIDAGIMASVPIYKNLPGLIYKYFTVGDSNAFGGVYIWKSRADAESHFSDAWKAGVTQKYGSIPRVTYLDVVTTTDGPAGR